MASDQSKIIKHTDSSSYELQKDGLSEQADLKCYTYKLLKEMKLSECLTIQKGDAH